MLRFPCYKCEDSREFTSDKGKISDVREDTHECGQSAARGRGNVERVDARLLTGLNGTDGLQIEEREVRPDARVSRIVPLRIREQVTYAAKLRDLAEVGWVRSRAAGGNNTGE